MFLAKIKGTSKKALISFLITKIFIAKGISSKRAIKNKSAVRRPPEAITGHSKNEKRNKETTAI